MRTVRHMLLLGALAGLTVGAAAGADSSSDETIPTVTLAQESKGVVAVEGRFVARADKGLVWKALSDYDALSDLVTSLVKSETVERGKDRALVIQHAKGQLWIFSRTLKVLLEIKEDPAKKIVFHDVSKESFHLYEGSWTLETLADGKVEVTYRLKAKQKEKVPGFILRHMAQHLAVELLTELRDAIHNSTKRQTMASRSP